MTQEKRDSTKVDPLSGAEESTPTPPLATVPEGEKPNATNAVIPGTGEVIRDVNGKEIKRVIRT
jgi:hypothetical protein